MPFVSKAQRAKMAILVKQGKMTQEKFDEYAAETPNEEDLPERVTPKKEKGINANNLKSIDDVKKYRKQKFGI